MRNDERDQDRERKFVPKRLGTGMDAKGKQRGRPWKWEEQLHNSTFHEHMWDGVHCQQTIISNQPERISPIYDYIPCKI